MGGLCNSNRLLDHSTCISFPAQYDCPWVTFVARNILSDADEGHWKYYPYFSNRRHFALPGGLARIIGKPALFSLANSWAKFYQVDTHRKPVAMKDEFQETLTSNAASFPGKPT
jgi:hypothetical protein